MYPLLKCINYYRKKKKISKYASLHGNQAAIRHFSKQLGVIFRLHVEWACPIRPTIWPLNLWHAHACLQMTWNLKLWKFFLKVFWSIIRKFAPMKISRYTVYKLLCLVTAVSYSHSIYLLQIQHCPFIEIVQCIGVHCACLSWVWWQPFPCSVHCCWLW